MKSLSNLFSNLLSNLIDSQLYILFVEMFWVQDISGNYLRKRI